MDSNNFCEAASCPAAAPASGFTSAVAANPAVFCTAVTISIVALLSYLTFKFAHRIKDWILKLTTISFEITGPMDPCSDIYRYTLNWLYDNVPNWPHHQVTSHSHREEDGRVTTIFKKPPAIDASPYYFKYNGVWIQVQRKRLGEVGIIEDMKPIECVTFRTLRGNSSVFESILEDIKSNFKDVEPDETRTRFYYAHDGSYWAEFGNAKRKRPLNSVILNESTLNGLVNDVKEFRDTEDWYRDRGIPYRRGYLLYGPPGNGKSSFVKAIAGEFGYNICILSLSSSKHMNDDSLNNLMNSTPENSIILLEDIDAAFPSREIGEGDDDEKKSKMDLRSPEGEASSGKVTLRGLLNSLDGVASTEGRLVFLTTNYVDRLDPAMTRPGRVDMKVVISLPTDQQIYRMFTRFYPEAPEEDRVEFVKVIRGLKKPVSMAMIQGLFMLHKQSHAQVAASAPEYFEEQFFSLTSPHD